MSAETVAKERDYVADMRAAIDKATEATPYSAPSVAMKLVSTLRQTDMDLLTGWLDYMAVSIVLEAISARDQSARSHLRATASRSVFADAAKDAATGNIATLKGFLNVPWTLRNGDRKPLGDFNKDDLLKTAQDYGTRSAQNLMNEAFMRAIAKKVPLGRQVRDVFTDEQLSTIWASLGNPK